MRKIESGYACPGKDPVKIQKDLKFTPQHDFWHRNSLQQ